MAWTERRTGGYIGRYRDSNGRTKATTVFRRKRDAQEAADRQEQLVKRGEWTDPAQAKITVSEWATLWLAGLDVTRKTRHGYEERLNSLILPRWGAIRLTSITLTDVRNWVVTMSGARGKPASDTRRRDAATQFVRMLDAAVDADRLRSNPARTRAGKTPYVPRARRAKAHRYLSAEELWQLADAAGSNGTMLLLAGYTGLRWGEISALTIGSYNPLSGRLSVERAYSNVGGVIVLGETKTHERRDVAVPSFLREPLVALGAGKTPNDLLFATGNGGPLDSRNFSQRVLTPAWRVAGIARLTFHDLRHTAASLAIASGANVLAVSQMLGHASAKMTLDIYAGLFDTHVDEVAERLNERAMAARAHYLPTKPTAAALVDDGLRAV